MTIGIDTDPSPGRLAPQGALTIYEAAGFKERLLSALVAAPCLAIDLAGIDEFDTAGAQLLVLAAREAARAGKPIELVACSATVQEVLQRYGLERAFGPGATAQARPAPHPLPHERSLA